VVSTKTVDTHLRLEYGTFHGDGQGGEMEEHCRGNHVLAQLKKLVAYFAGTELYSHLMFACIHDGLDK
jgi:hypothetical protein